MPCTSCAQHEELSLPARSPKGAPLRQLGLPGFYMDISSNMSTLFTVSQRLSHKIDAGRRMGGKEKDEEWGGVRESHQALDRGGIPLPVGLRDLPVGCEGNHYS